MPSAAIIRPLLSGEEPLALSIGNADLAEIKRVAADASVPLLTRLDAYEDLVESEVGDTGLSRARNLERDTGPRQIYLKMEGDNPSGTQKDRIAFAQAMDALRRGFGGVTVATCGNYGVAVAFSTSLAGLGCEVVVPERYRTRRIEEMKALGANIHRSSGTYEDAVERSRRLAIERELYDANPGGANEIIQLRAYAQIADEIYDQLRDAPAVVALPMSNGTTLAGVHRGFHSLFRRGKTSRMPRVVGGSAYRKNPIVRAFRRGVERCEDLPPESIHETHVNEPLVNWHAIDGDLALDAIRTSGGWAADVSDAAMRQMARALKTNQGLHVMPAATAGLLALLEGHGREPLPPDRYVVVLTGRQSQ